MKRLFELKPVSIFWRRHMLVELAKGIGCENEKKVLGGTLKMTPSRIKMVADCLETKIEDEGKYVYSGGCLYQLPIQGDPLSDDRWTNYGDPQITEDEIQWMEAIMYSYGLPWGG